MDETVRTLTLPGFHRLVFGRDGVFAANTRDVYVGQALIQYGEFSHLEMVEFEKHVDADTTVVEVGANIGAHTVGLARLARRVIAIEPQPFLFYTLCAQVVLNSLQNVICLHCALGAEAGSLPVPRVDYSYRGNFAGIALDRADLRREDYSLDVKTLDAVAAAYSLSGKVFLKIDVEGMERDVLAGGRETIRRLRPTICLENDRPDRSEALMACVAELGYRATPQRPRLFNPDNFFGNAKNDFGELASFNELCEPADPRPAT
jgi:FkbM family methyltransferase